MRTRLLLAVMFVSTAGLAGSAQKMQASRLERRGAHVAEMRTHYRDVLEKPEAQAEMRDHARRMARLHRVRAVAMDAGDTSIATRAEVLLDRQQKHFEKQMNVLGAKK
jgi:hypothetical protein